MDHTRVRITGVILTRDCKDIIESTINWHKPYVDSLMAVDDSTDGTTSILREMCDVVIVHKYQSFDIERNLSHRMISTGWVLVFDADERFNIEFMKTMHQMCHDNSHKYDSFRFPRLNPDPNPIWPDYQVRLYKPDLAEWREPPHVRPWNAYTNQRLDKYRCKTLNEYPIIHLSNSKDWDDILSSRAHIT